MLGDLAFDLAARGYEVTVITSRQLYEDAGAQLLPLETVRGVEVRRVATSSFGRGNLVGRALDYATFYLSAAITLWRVARRGVTVVAKTDPPLISVLAALVCGLRGAGLVNWLQDLFPEVAEAAGARFARGALGKLLAWLRDRSLLRADCNVVLGERMAARLLARGIPRERTAIVANWADGSNIQPVESSANAVRRDWGLAGAFVVAYSGNMGRVHEFDTILDAARRLKHEAGIRFLFIGGGRWRGWLEETARQEGLDAILFKPYQPREALASSLGVADVHLVSLLPAMEGLVVPSKFYGIVAAGRPTVFVGDPEGEIPQVLSKHDIGIAVQLGRTDDFVAALLALRENAERRRAMGARARAVFEAEYDKPIAMAKWEAVLRQVAARDKNSSATA
jgi:glycosyltransferase involved in cell wall biosynthesis